MADKDSLYIKGLKEGDHFVFEQIFREYYPLLCNFARRYTTDKALAEEVVQDFFCRLWDKQNEINITTGLSSYLRKSVLNHCLNFTRKLEIERKFVNYGENLEELYGTNDFDSNSELSEHLDMALAQLPEKRREIFELSRFEGLKYHEIAEKLNINIKTVETQMTRSLDFMRKYLKDFIISIVLIMNMINKM
ncbi:MAG: RNA polymerase sigma-70 factor [Bacteroidales bacterium]